MYVLYIDSILVSVADVSRTIMPTYPDPIKSEGL